MTTAQVQSSPRLFTLLLDDGTYREMSLGDLSASQADQICATLQTLPSVRRVMSANGNAAGRNGHGNKPAATPPATPPATVGSGAAPITLKPAAPVAQSLPPKPPAPPRQPAPVRIQLNDEQRMLMGRARRGNAVRIGKVDGLVWEFRFGDVDRAVEWLAARIERSDRAAAKAWRQLRETVIGAKGIPRR